MRHARPAGFGVALLMAALSMAGPASAQRGASDISRASALATVSLASVPVAMLGGGVMLGVVAVRPSVRGVVCVLERASDGARSTVELVGGAALGSALVVGATVVVSAVPAGWLLSVGSQALAVIPNAAGSALLHNERVSR